MAMVEALEKRDVVEAICCQIATGASSMTFHESIVHQIRTTMAARGVNRLFRDEANVLLEKVMWMFATEMHAFDKEAIRVCSTWIDIVAYMRLLHKSAWAGAVFGLNLYVPTNTEMVWTLQQFQTRRDPTTCTELLNLVERRCICCGTQCKHLARQNAKLLSAPKPWIDAAQLFSAFLMHPYKGDILKIQEKCIIQGMLVPFTHEDHFMEVCIVHNKEERCYYMVLHVFARATSEELRLERFLHAAKSEPWYQRRIKRLFDLRDRKVACIERSDRCVAFTAHVCMFAPYLSDPEDWSIQSIFDLTPAKVHALIRRGGAMLREERLLE
tara:strand:- start:230 stop:1210 length:981 start_codon:yes stop_codon:yes gene_type:complete